MMVSIKGQPQYHMVSLPEELLEDLSSEELGLYPGKKIFVRFNGNDVDTGARIFSYQLKVSSHTVSS